MTLDLSRFFTVARELFHGGYSQEQVQGLTAILDGWQAWLPGNPDLKPNIRWLAYALATTFHETGERMVPVREIGLGKGRAYGDAKPNGQTYYGRGYVQLTWDDNYSTFGERMGIPLYDKPDLALDPTTALAIMLDGMAGGHFTGRRLGQYFGDDPHRDDPVNARRIINGLDQAAGIAGYHRVFLQALSMTPITASPTAPIATSVHAGAGAAVGRPVAQASGQQNAETTADALDDKFNPPEGLA